MKRFSPLLIVAAAAAAAILAAVWRGGNDELPAETWKPVDPS